MRYIIHGINGRMGQTLVECIAQMGEEIVCGIDRADSQKASEGIRIYKSIEDVLAHSEDKLADAIIDFSNYQAVGPVLAYARKTSTPIVIATTALEENEKRLILEASKEIPVFNSFNMSLGINLIAKMSKLAMPSLESNYNVEILEMHHNKKIDSPSGTALMLADAINEACEVKKDYVYGRHSKNDDVKLTDLGIHAIRGGSVPGTHTVVLAGPDEVIELKHTVYSRSVFAYGALSAAKFIVARPAGLYTMDDII